MTVKEVSEEFLTTKIAMTTFDYARSVKNMIEYLNQNYGDCEIDSLKPKDMDMLINKLSLKNPKTGKPSSKSTLKRLVQSVSSVFNYAIENEMATKNPMLNRKIPKNAPYNPRRALTDEEKNLLLRTEHRAKIAAMIMMFAGLRRGEVIPLKWVDIDFANNLILVNKSATKADNNKFYVKSNTKNGKSRAVYMPEVLNSYLKQEKLKATSQFLTTSKSGEMHTLTTWSQMWKSYQTALNLANLNDMNRSIYNPNGVPKTVDNITPHMLRHTYATILYSAGVDVKTAAKLLGHSDIKTTLTIYTHLEEEKQIKSVDCLDKYIQSKFEI